MAVICPRCDSSETQTLMQNNQCLTCGGLFDFDGNPAEGGFDQSTRDAIQRRLEPRAVVVVGNFADLQRGGAQAATHGSAALASDGVARPPGTEHRELITPAEDDARKGEVTRNANPNGDELVTTSSAKPTKRTRAADK